jgi:selenide,water dikinase
VGILCTASRVGEADEQALKEAIASMTTLNKCAAQICRNYDIHACTDVTGFGFLGHLHEMMDGKLSCVIHAENVPVIQNALACADEFLLTAAGQRNRNYVGEAVTFEGVPFAMEEVLFDPQTSGGLLAAVNKDEADSLEKELRDAGLPAAIVGEITEKQEKEIYVNM